MSTRCRVLLRDGDNEQWFYRHCDGYPSMVEPILRMATKFLPIPGHYHKWSDIEGAFQRGINLIAQGCYMFSETEWGLRDKRAQYKEHQKNPNVRTPGGPHDPMLPAVDRHWFQSERRAPADYAHEYKVVHQGGSWILYVDDQITWPDVWCTFPEE